MLNDFPVINNWTNYNNQNEFSLNTVERSYLNINQTLVSRSVKLLMMLLTCLHKVRNHNSFTGRNCIIPNTWVKWTPSLSEEAVLDNSWLLQTPWNSRVKIGLGASNSWGTMRKRVLRGEGQMDWTTACKLMFSKLKSIFWGDLYTNT